MGIHNLSALLKKHSPDSIQSASLSTLKGKRLGIDASIFIYKSLTTMRYKNDYFRDNEGKVISHIIGIFYKTITYISVGAIPIYIFDGKPPSSKQNTIDERNKKAAMAKQEMNKVTDILDKEKLEKQTIRILPEYIEGIKQLLNLMGVSYIHPNGEAEAYASELCRIGYIDYVVSEDMDTLVFQAPKMIRSCMDPSIKRNDVISIITLDKVLEDFNMTINEFVDMCILCGCDYCETIKNIGCQKSFKFIQKYKTIEGIIESENLIVTDEFTSNYQTARDTFSIFYNKLDIDSIQLITSHYKQTELEDFLVKTCGMSSKRVENSIKKITQCS